MVRDFTFTAVETLIPSVVEILFSVVETYGIRTSQFLAGKLAGRLLSAAACQHTQAAIRRAVQVGFLIALFSSV